MHHQKLQRGMVLSRHALHICRRPKERQPSPGEGVRGGSSGEVEKYLVDVMCVPYDMPRDRRYKWTNARIGNERTRALVFSRHPHFVKGADCDDKGPGSGRYGADLGSGK